MPLNSYKCEQCGKRNNYSVELDYQGNQTVRCVICGHEQVMTYEQLPERVQADIEHKQNIDESFSHDGSFFDNLASQRAIDTLSVMEQHFQETQDDLNSFVRDVSVDTDMQSIINQYVPDMETGNILDEIVVKTIGDDGELSDDWKRHGIDVALSEVGQMVPDDSSSGRIVSYIQQVLRSGRGLDTLGDSELMQASGLTKKERFILKQAIKNDQINSIISQVLGGESF